MIGFTFLPSKVLNDHRMIILFFYFKKLFITLKNVGDGVMSVPQNLPHSVGSSFLPNMVEFKRHFCRLKNDGG